MPEDRKPATLLRLAAFLLDVLFFALSLILPATLVSWGVLWFGEASNTINIVWWVALLLLTVAILVRDGWHGRSPGKRLFGLRVVTRRGNDCGVWRSVLRNLPLLVPLWNVIELVLVLSPRTVRRSGDYLARTVVVEE